MCKDNLTYKNNLNYKETVIARNEVTKQSRKATNITRLLRYARNDDTYCKSTILNSNNNLTPHPSPSPSRGEGYCPLCSQSLIFNFQSSIFNFSKSAFSLIELSIVLIIIGLLVAGVTGGASLIQSAKIRSFINELNSYKQAVYSFVAAKGRLPGDLNNDGYSGPCNIKNDKWYLGCKAETYSASSFAAPYNTDSSTPDQYSGPFVDLYLENVIDFAPDKDNIKVAGKGYPYSKIFKDGYFALTSFADNHTNYDGADKNNCWINNTNAGNYSLLLEAKNRSIETKVVSTIDEKIDDGVYNTGTFRGYCHGSKNGREDYTLTKKCSSMIYKIK